MFLEMLYTFLMGIFFVLFVEFLVLWRWFSKRKQCKSTKRGLEPRIYESTKLPEVVKNALLEGDGVVETCVWFNSILSFLFDEWRDSIEAKQVIMNKLKREFDELLSKALGKLVKDLTVRECNLGTSLPVVHRMQVLKKQLTPNGCNLQELDVLLDIEYKDGDFELAIDADVLFQKSAFVVIKVCHVKGSVVLKFTKEPFSHWSFSFVPDPEIRLCVTAEVEGRSVSQIANVIENQLHKTVQKKHTLPNCKARFKPFLPPQVSPNCSENIYYNGTCLSSGELEVNIVRVEKLPQPNNVQHVYCTMSLDLVEHVAFCDLPMCKWAVNEVKVEASALSMERILGVEFYDVYVLLKDERHRVPAVYRIDDQHVASSYGIRVNDVLDTVNGTNVSSVKDARDLINSASLLFRFLRPPTSAVIIPRQIEDNPRKAVKLNEAFQTKSKPLSRAISWGQSSTFVIGEDEEYMFLNVCIWGVVKEDRRDLLLGKVSLKLMDIALKCTMTSSNVHKEKLFFVPSDTQQALVKKAHESSNKMLGRVSPNVRLPAELKAYNFFPGCVILEFHYDLTQEVVSASSDMSDDENLDQDEGPSARQTVFVANTKHQFQQSVGRKDATRICSICQKKFKSALILQCQRCGLLCDHKCAKYSIKQVKCLSDPTHPQVEDGSFVSIDTAETDDVDEEIRRIRIVLQKLKTDLATVDDSDAQMKTYLRDEIIHYTRTLESLDKRKWQNQ